MILGISLLLLVVGVVIILLSVLVPPYEENWLIGGATTVMLSLIFGFILLGNVAPVSQKIEKVEKFIVGELGLITNHADFGLNQITDFKIIEDLKSGEFDLFIEYSLNSYDGPLLTWVAYFVRKKDVTEKEVDISKIEYRVKYRYGSQ